MKLINPWGMYEWKGISLYKYRTMVIIFWCLEWRIKRTIKFSKSWWWNVLDSYWRLCVKLW